MQFQALVNLLKLNVESCLRVEKKSLNTVTMQAITPEDKCGFYNRAFYQHVVLE